VAVAYQPSGAQAPDQLSRDRENRLVFASSVSTFARAGVATVCSTEKFAGESSFTT